MPKFNKSRVDAQPHGRYKRFVSTLAKAFSPLKGNGEIVKQTKG